MNKKLATRIKSVFTVGLAAVMLSASAYGANYSEADAQEKATDSTKWYIVGEAGTSELKYVAAPDLPKYSEEEIERLCAQYDPYAQEDQIASAAQPGSINASSVKINNPQNDERCRNTVLIEGILDNGDPVKATGFMLGPNAVATSGHVVIDRTSGLTLHRIKEATVIPACNDGTKPAPYGTAEMDRFICSPNWAVGGNEQEDWGIIILDKNIGYNVGWLGLQKPPLSKYTNKEINVNGYPLTSYDLYLHTGTVGKDWGTYFRSYDIKTAEGESGAPCYIYSSKTGYTAIGILQGMSNAANGSTYVEITSSLFDTFLSYRTSTLT